MTFYNRAAITLGLITAMMTAPPASSETVTYTYDARGRLATASYSTGATVTYSYDAAGNRTQVVVTGGANTNPVAVNDTLAATQNTTTGTFDPRTNDTDANGDTLTITAKTNGAHGTVTIVGGGTGVTYAPASGYTGPDSFTYTISDGHGGPDTGTVNVTVSASTNHTPVANSDTADANAYYAGGAWVYPSVTFDPRTNDTDADADTLTITSVTQGSSGTVTFNGSSVTYTYGTRYHPTGMFAEIMDGDSFTYTISDGHGGEATETVGITVVVW